jgi:glucose/arabinose dehydrogenase
VLELEGEKCLVRRDVRRAAAAAIAAVLGGNGGQRIRDVREAPDGAVYLLTDEAAGRLLRVEP